MISQEKINIFLSKLDRSPPRQLISNAIKARGIEDVSSYYSSYKLHPPTLDYDSKWEQDFRLGGPVSLAYFIISQSGLIKDPSFSWIYFWDLLQRSALFLNSVLEDESDVNYSKPLSNEFSLRYYQELIGKYGIVTSEDMQAVYHTEQRAELEILLHRKLRQSAELLKRFISNPKTLDKHKDKCLNDIFGMLSHCIGIPPSSGIIKIDEEANPFNKYELTCSISLKNANYGRVELGSQSLINLCSEDFLNVLTNSLKSGQALICTCETPRRGLRLDCLISDDKSDYSEALATCLDLDKTKRLVYQDVASFKPAVISGVKLRNDKVEIWKLTDASGDHFIAYDWPGEHVFLMLVKKELLDTIRNYDLINLSSQDEEMLKKILRVDD